MTLQVKKKGCSTGIFFESQEPLLKKQHQPSIKLIDKHDTVMKVHSIFKQNWEIT